MGLESIRRDRLVVVGIGNPGDKYANTRHNAGFIVLDAYAQKHGLSFANRPRLQVGVALVLFSMFACGSFRRLPAYSAAPQLGSCMHFRAR